MTLAAPILAAFLALGAPLDYSLEPHACGSSRDIVVYARAVRHGRATRHAIRRWSRWISEQPDRHCLTLYLAPVPGSDGKRIPIHMLLVFRIIADPPPRPEPPPPSRERVPGPPSSRRA